MFLLASYTLSTYWQYSYDLLFNLDVWFFIVMIFLTSYTLTMIWNKAKKPEIQTELMMHEVWIAVDLTSVAVDLPNCWLDWLISGLIECLQSNINQQSSTINNKFGIKSTSN